MKLPKLPRFNCSWLNPSKYLFLAILVVSLLIEPPLTPAYAAAGDIRMVSVYLTDYGGNWDSDDASVSADGRYVVFDSPADNLVSANKPFTSRILVRDLLLGLTEQISPDTEWSWYPSISADGRYIAYMSTVDLTSTPYNISVYDMHTGSTTLISYSYNGTPVNGDSEYPVISADGTLVAFQSSASNLIPNDVNGKMSDIFVYDLLYDKISIVDVSTGGQQANWNSTNPSISANGSFVSFVSSANNLVAEDSNQQPDMFVRELATGFTTRVSVASDGTQANDLTTYYSSVDDYGDVVFASHASNLVPDDTNNTFDVFVHELDNGVTTRVSVASDGTQAMNSHYSYYGGSNIAKHGQAITQNGRYVTFESTADNLVPGGLYNLPDIYIYDMATNETIRASNAANGTHANDKSFSASLSNDGKYIVFSSDATNLIPGVFPFPRSQIYIRENAISNIPAITISGNTGASGVTLHYVDGIVKSVVSSADGSYSISVPYNWSGYIVPSKTDLAFTPPNRVYINIQADQTGQDYTVTTPPIIIVHGWQGASFSDGGYHCSQDIQLYDGTNTTLGSLPDWFKDAGYQVWIAHLETTPLSTDTLEKNAKCLRDQIKVVATNNSLPITVVSHSMGGLVSRAAIGYLDPSVKIRSLYTLGSPHAGIGSQPESIDVFSPPPNSGGVYCVLQPVVCEMTPQFMSSFFNMFNPNLADIKYYFIGGDGGSGFLSSSLITANGANDGLVGRYSAVGWDYPLKEFNPSNWASLSMPGQYFTNEAHIPAWGNSYYSPPSGKTHSNSYECVIAIMNGQAPSSSYCQLATNAPTLLAPTANISTLSSNNPLSFTEIKTGHLNAGQAISLPLIIDSTGNTQFFINWNGGSAPVFTLTRPDAQVINPSYATAHPTEVTYQASPSSPETAPSALYDFVSGMTGTWQINITATDAINYKTFGIMDSPLQLTAQTNADAYSSGDSAAITANLSNSGTGLAGATVNASISRPDSVVDVVPLTDQGNGIYSGNYIIPNTPGYLAIAINANGNNNGVLFKRQKDLLALIKSNALQLTGTYNDLLIDNDNNSIYEKLNFTIDVNLATAGEYAVAADLYAGSQYITHTGDFFALVSGVQTITLSFGGNAIHTAGVDGPYTIKNLSLTPIDTGITSQNVDSAWTTPAYSYTQFIDTTAPVVSSITRASSNPTSTASVDFTVTFAESVADVDAGDFALITTGVTGATITGVSGSDATYTVTVNTGSGNGTIGLVVWDDDSIVDAANNPLGGVGLGNGNFITGETYDINKEKILNGGFNTYPTGKKVPTNWKAVKFSTADGKTTTVKKEGTASVRITGTGVSKTLSQTLMLNGSNGDPFTFSFWAKGSSIPTAGVCRAQILFYNGAILNPIKKTVNCANRTYAFKQKLLSFTAPGDYTKIVIRFTYSKASGRVWFDAVSLVR